MNGMWTRRFFLTRWASGLGILAIQMLRKPLSALADTDEFSGTDFVGKTRVGRYQKFYINFWKPMRRIRPERWRLEVFGLCEKPQSFDLKTVRTFPQRSRNSRLKCVECWSARAQWQGFDFLELEKRVRPLADAKGVVFHCADAYVEHLSRETLKREEVLLVTHMNGEPLTDEHGFPLRVIAPFKYGYKNPKAILKIEFVSEVRYGTWSKIGPYSPDGTVLPGIDHPLEHGKKPHRIPGGEVLDY